MFSSAGWFGPLHPSEVWIAAKPGNGRLWYSRASQYTVYMSKEKTPAMLFPVWGKPTSIGYYLPPGMFAWGSYRWWLNAKRNARETPCLLARPGLSGQPLMEPEEEKKVRDTPFSFRERPGVGAQKNTIFPLPGVHCPHETLEHVLWRQIHVWKFADLWHLLAMHHLFILNENDNEHIITVRRLSSISVL